MSIPTTRANRLRSASWARSVAAWRLATGDWRLATGDWRLATGDHAVDHPSSRDNPTRGGISPNSVTRWSLHVGRARLSAKCQPGELGPAATTGLLANAVEVGADSAHADKEFFGDLVVSEAFSDKSQEFPLPLA